jgi:hypothetical protein
MTNTQNVNDSGNVNIIPNLIEIVNHNKTKPKTSCMHTNCPECGGTGRRKNGLGSCIHMMVCPCDKCNPFYFEQ